MDKALQRIAMLDEIGVELCRRIIIIVVVVEFVLICPRLALAFITRRCLVESPSSSAKGDDVPRKQGREQPVEGIKKYNLINIIMIWQPT
jgi:hypothetical protein